jgi:hypothetical protein
VWGGSAPAAEQTTAGETVTTRTGIQWTQRDALRVEPLVPKLSNALTGKPVEDLSDA